MIILKELLNKVISFILQKESDIDVCVDEYFIGSMGNKGGDSLKDDPINKIREFGNIMISKSQYLKELAKVIPDQARKLEAYGEYYIYVANEYDRLNLNIGIDLGNSTKFNFNKLEKALDWKTTSVHDVTTTTVAASACSTSITEPFLPYIDDQPVLKILDDPPESFKILKTTNKVIDKLNQLKKDLGKTWESAWNAFTINDPSSVKTAAVNIRTVFDELCWMTPYEDLKKLDWCCLDDNGQPTRATRFAWILYGNELPVEYKNKPFDDPLWELFNKNYAELQKYVHITSLKKSNLVHLEVIIKALQESLEQYLYFGFERLKSMK